MKIAEFSVKNYQFTLIIFFLMVALGVNSLLNMPRGEDPEMVQPSFSIAIIYPGTSPVDMEKLIVDPVEKRLNELEDIKKLITSINDGLAVFRVDYKYDVDADTKYQEIVREINALRLELPQDIFDIKILKFSSTDVAIFQLALVSETASYRELEKHAERFEDELEKVKGLKGIATHGYPEQQLRVSLNLEKMALNHIPVNAVVGSLQSENINIPGGNVQVGVRKFNVKTSGDYKSVDEIKNTIVYSNAGKNVLLKDVADVELDYEDRGHITRLNGHRSVLVTANQKDGQNIFKVADEVKPVFEAFAKSLPSNITMVKNFDQSVSVSKRLTQFSRDFLIAILLVSITLLPLGNRAALVVMISIPLSIFTGLFLLDMFGYTINQLSVVGLIVALGILVDDSIVVIENIERYLRAGRTKLQASIEATKQIGLAVVGCTATLILAFLPLMYLPEAAGDFIRSLPMAVITTVLASLFVSLTIVPFLSSRLLKNQANPEGNIFMRAMKRVIKGTYGKVLHKALAYPAITLIIATLLFVGSLLLFPLVGFSLFPRSEKPQFLINIETPSSSSLDETDRVARYVESELKNIKEVQWYTANVGKGNPRVYYNEIQRNLSTSYSQFFVQCYDLSPEKKTKLIDELREKFLHYPNAQIKVKDFEQGPPLEAPVAIRIFGDNLDSLRSISMKVETIIKKIPGTIYVDNPLSTRQTDLHIKINKEKAGMLGIPISEIDKTVRLGIAGINIGKFTPNEGADEIFINISVPRTTELADYSVFEKLYVSSLSGQSIPLRQVATIEFETSPNLIRHYDKIRYATVSAFVKSGYLYDEINSAVIKELDKFPFPSGCHIRIARRKRKFI